MTNTTNLSVALVAANQAQKEVTVNTAITTIDAILNRGAIDRALNTPPGSPANGDLYIIGNSPTGDWSSKADEVAYYQSGWSFIGPNEGMSIWVNDENLLYTWDGSAWVTNGISPAVGDAMFAKNITGNDVVVSRIELKDYSQSHSTPVSSSGALTLDLENGNVFEVTLTENVTTTVFSNPPASGRGGSFKLILKQDGTGGRTFTWPASVDWAGSSAPTLTTTANAVDILTFLTTDGGTVWYGFLNGAAMG